MADTHKEEHIWLFLMLYKIRYKLILPFIYIYLLHFLPREYVCKQLKNGFHLGPCICQLHIIIWFLNEIRQQSPLTSIIDL